MEKGINLSLTRSLAEFDKLLDQAIETAFTKKLSVAHELDEEDSWKFQVGKYVKIDNEGKDEDEETALFWIGLGWEENDNHDSSIWLEFDAKTCPAKYWDKINSFVGTSGKYYSDVDFEFAQVYMNAWIHFILKKEYLERFYDENADKNAQIEILTGFIDDVLGKIIDINDLFDFEFNEAEGYWSVTGYYGRGEEMVFPASHEGKPIKAIGELAFSGCTGIKEIRLPESLTSIGEMAFNGCTGLTDIKFPDSLTSIGDYAFWDCTGLKNIKLPKGLVSIGDSAFQGCTGLMEVIFPKGLSSIEEWAFYGCTGLKRIKLSENLTTFNTSGFNNCKELAEINVDENNPVFCSVDGVMFDKAMTTLMWFPQGKKGKYSVPEGIISIRRGAFDNCQLTDISFPQSLLSIKDNGFNCEQLTDITVNGQNPCVCSIDGVLFDKEMRELIEYPRNRDKTDYTVPAGIKDIDSNTFYGCKHIVNILLPESLEYIGDYAFANCEGLKAITLPANLQFIGERAFEGCTNLETVTLSRKTRIGHKAFEGFKGKLVYRD